MEGDARPSSGDRPSSTWVELLALLVIFLIMAYLDWRDFDSGRKIEGFQTGWPQTARTLAIFLTWQCGVGILAGSDRTGFVAAVIGTTYTFVSLAVIVLIAHVANCLRPEPTGPSASIFPVMLFLAALVCAGSGVVYLISKRCGISIPRVLLSALLGLPLAIFAVGMLLLPLVLRESQ